MLGDDPVGNIAADVRQSEITTGVTIGQFFVVQTHQMQDRCMKIMHVNSVFNNINTMIVGRAIDDTRLHPPPSKP